MTIELYASSDRDLGQQAEALVKANGYRGWSRQITTPITRDGWYPITIKK
jgi:hypothetical protein